MGPRSFHSEGFFCVDDIDDFVKSGTEPDNLFQMLSKHSGRDGRRFGVYR
jgi:hypothetical protein